MWAITLDQIWSALPADHALLTEGLQRRAAADQRAAVRRAAGYLFGLGLRKGEVLLLHAPRSVATLDLHLGALAIGAITLPAHPGATPRELQHLVHDARPALIVSTHPIPGAVDPGGVAAALAAAPSREPDPTVNGSDLALLLYTSGTTGAPKGAMITHDNVAATVRALHVAWGWSAADVLLHTLPIAHVHGLIVAAHGALYAGAHAVWLDRFEPQRVLDAIAAHQVTVYMGVPTHYARLATAPAPSADLRSLRLMTSGSAPLSAELHGQIAQRFGVQIVERYGMTEVGIVVSNPVSGVRKPGSIGLPLPGVSAKVVDSEGCTLPPGEIGELWIAGPSVFRGYWDRPSQTAEVLVDGWMHTGDLGFADEDGYLHLVGRRSEMILSGGFNVYPAEIEPVLASVPGVREVAIVGIPDPDLGERVVAALVTDGEVHEDALRDVATRELSPYKRPRNYLFVDSLPRTELGKVQRKVLVGRLMSPQIRPATDSDAERILGANVEMARETEGLALDPVAAARGVARALAGEVDARYFIAEILGFYAGQCMVTREWSDWRGQYVWWIQSVYVAPGHRKTGVYRSLHEHIIRSARAEGAAGVRLYVDHRNHGAAATYTRVGMAGGHYDLFEQMFDEPPLATEIPL